MPALFRFPAAVTRSPAVDTWLSWQKGEFGQLARHWLEVLRTAGPDVRELLHDGHPTLCVTDAAFAYLDAFKAHVNVGFFHGADLPDPAGLLEGSGKSMRHVKLRPGVPIDTAALSSLIAAAYANMSRRVQQGQKY